MSLNASLFSYIVAEDYGFAPNPFHGVCTLATCKPRIRSVARVGDWVIGTGTARHSRKGYLVYAMRVTDTLTFDEYSTDLRFVRKKPNLNGSRKLAYGDNIYRRDENGIWVQLDSHHSHIHGAPNVKNLLRDTSTNRVLISDDYAYWGGSGPMPPPSIRDSTGRRLIHSGIGHRRIEADAVDEFVDWLRSLNQTGFLGRPSEWG